MKKELLTPYAPSALGLMYPALRRYVRATIRAELDYERPAIVSDTALHLLNQFCHTCGQIDGAVLGMIARQFPVFLVPGPEIDLDDLRECAVEMYWDNNSWYLQLQGAGGFLLIYLPNYSTSTLNTGFSPNNECLL